MKSCLRQEYNHVYSQLNRDYGECYRYIEQVPRTGVKKPDSEKLILLKKSQRAWLYFRDKECELILSNEDVQDLIDPYSDSEWLSCMIIQTNTLTRQLKL
ncbi:lysozyme inhibitor LprI family protein, partial [Klebsiella pneumoniae]|uniref:lysozyme inhibitor LprI family protein n=1 Tax=Klebsiella pneumoniae TaxID=573 RepID=UPI0025541480